MTYNQIYNYFNIFITENFFSDDSSTVPSFLNDRKILYGPYKLNAVKAKTSSWNRNINIDKYNKTVNGVTYTIKWYADSSNLDDVIDKESTKSFTYK